MGCRKLGCARAEKKRAGPREFSWLGLSETGLQRLDRAEAKRKKGKETFCKFSLEFKQMNSNTGLNSTNQKLCSSMYATINFYGSLI
jgi:hypothetical protein